MVLLSSLLVLGRVRSVHWRGSADLKSRDARLEDFGIFRESLSPPQVCGPHAFGKKEPDEKKTPPPCRTHTPLLSLCSFASADNRWCRFVRPACSLACSSFSPAGGYVLQSPTSCSRASRRPRFPSSRVFKLVGRLLCKRVNNGIATRPLRCTRQRQPTPTPTKAICVRFSARAHVHQAGSRSRVAQQY